MCLKGDSVLKNCKQTAEKCKQIFENNENLPPLKYFLVLSTWGQILILWRYSQISIFPHGTSCNSKQLFSVKTLELN